MKLYVAPCQSNIHYREQAFRDLASSSETQIHSFTRDPEKADYIIIFDSLFTYLHHLRLLSKYLYKCYQINSDDKPYCYIPGLYASAPASFLHKYRFRGYGYSFRSKRRSNFFVSSPNNNVDKKYLFSFVGAPTSLVRKRLFKTNFHRSDILIRCTSDYNHWKQNRHPNPEEMQKSYVNAIQSSKFVLCPRGAGLGSIRLFEVMEMGVAPIIIADGWIPPNGPDWHEFAVFVKESEVKNICKIAESHASEYKERGRLARKAWEQYFSDRVVFNRCIEAIEDLQQNRIPTLDKFIFYCYPPILSIGELRKSIMGFLKPIILNLFDRLKLKYTYKIK